MLPNGKGGFAGMFRPGQAGKTKGLFGAIGRAYDATVGRNTAKTIQANKEMAEYEFAKNKEMWDLGNQYNAPEAQMERLRQAGLNPNLVYGSGSAPGMSAGQLPKYNAPNQQYDYPAIGAGITGILSAYQDFNMKQAQTNNLEEQNKLIQQNTNLKNFQTKILGRKNLYEHMFEGGQYSEDGTPWEPSVADLYGNAMKAKYKSEGQKFEQKEKLFPHQLEFAKGKLKTQERGIMKADQEISKLKKDNEYYLTKMWSGIINQGLGTVSKFIPKLAGGKGRVQGSPMDKGASRAPWANQLKTNPYRRAKGKTGKPNGD